MEKHGAFYIAVGEHTMVGLRTVEGESTVEGVRSIKHRWVEIRSHACSVYHMSECASVPLPLGLINTHLRDAGPLC